MATQKNKKFPLILAIILLAVIAYWLFWMNDGNKNNLDQSQDYFVVEEPQDIIEKVEIQSGSTYSVLMTEAGIDPYTSQAIYNSAQAIYDLASIRVGKFIELVYPPEGGGLKELRYKVDSEDELIVRRVINEESVDDHIIPEVQAEEEAGWEAELIPIPYEVKLKVASGTVSSSMYEYAMENDIDERAIVELANAFQWSIDFSMDPRVGDTFVFAYEERYLDGEYVMPGRIFAGKYVNAGNEISLYYFEEDEENQGYFDAEGNSVQKMFLKAPVAFKYISSGFTTGLRYVEAFNVSTGHRAIDYAAALGTPIRAVGDGTVTMAAWNGAYGNMVKIRHNGTYSTNYGHMSKFAVKYGDRVKQGDTIGYVGSTGFSTGPHLHYEMVKNGVKVNPLLEVLPPGEPIKAENMDRFMAEKARFEAMFQEQ